MVAFSFLPDHALMRSTVFLLPPTLGRPPYPPLHSTNVRYWINHIIAWPRMDCCSVDEQQSVAVEVVVGDSSNIDDNKRCAGPRNVGPDKQEKMDCNAAGRYVFLRRTQSAGSAMVLCEVEVFAQESASESTSTTTVVTTTTYDSVPSGDVYQLKTSAIRQFQSNHHSSIEVGSAFNGYGKNFQGGDPYRACRTSTGSGCCWHSASGGNPWVAADMGRERYVSHAIIYPRLDCCAISEAQSKGLEVRISNQRNVADADPCADATDVEKETRINCGAKGRYLFVRRSERASSAMALCEIELFVQDLQVVAQCPDGQYSLKGECVECSVGGGGGGGGDTCPTDQYRSGKCEGHVNTWKCNDCTNAECPRSFYRLGECDAETKGFTCGKCANLQCNDGAEFRSGECTADTLGFECEACSNIECEPGKSYRAGACSGTEDGYTCEPCSNLRCKDGAEFQSGSCAGTRNNLECNPCSNMECGETQFRSGVCAGTANGYTCNSCDNVVCAAGEYRTGSCSGTSNAFECAVQPTCSPGEKYVNVPGPDETAATRKGSCTPCQDGTYMAATEHRVEECLPQSAACPGSSKFEAVAATASSDRVCESTTECTADQFESGRSDNGNRLCSTLATCPAGTYAKTAATKTSDRACEECEAGTFSTGSNAKRCDTVYVA